MSRESGYAHCPRCRSNVDGVLCPRCGVLTERGLLPRRAKRPVPREGEPIEVYRLSLRSIRDGGVDVEAS